jgi:hypothetical protein
MTTLVSQYAYRDMHKVDSTLKMRHYTREKRAGAVRELASDTPAPFLTFISKSMNGDIVGEKLEALIKGGLRGGEFIMFLIRKIRRVPQTMVTVRHAILII